MYQYLYMMIYALNFFSFFKMGQAVKEKFKYPIQ